MARNVMKHTIHKLGTISPWRYWNPSFIISTKKMKIFMKKLYAYIGHICHINILSIHEVIRPPPPPPPLLSSQQKIWKFSWTNNMQNHFFSLQYPCLQMGFCRKEVYTPAYKWAFVEKKYTPLPANGLLDIHFPIPLGRVFSSASRAQIR